MVVYLSAQNSILPDFSSLSIVAISVHFPEARNEKYRARARERASCAIFGWIFPVFFPQVAVGALLSPPR